MTLSGAGSGRFSSTAQEEGIFRLMLRRIGCGPFDGGCLVFAQALRRLYGGEVVVVEGRRLVGRHRIPGPECHGQLLAQHAVLALPDGTYMDASGRCAMQTMLERTAQASGGMVSAESIRPWRDGDLEDAARDEELVDELANLLQGAPKPEPRSPRRAKI